MAMLTVQEEIYKNTNKNVPLDKLVEALIGVNREERLRSRESIIRGLLPCDRWERVKELIGANKTTRKVQDLVVYIMWNGFIETIWRERCNKVTEWEREHGIDKKKKRSRLAQGNIKLMDRNSKQEHADNRRELGRLTNAISFTECLIRTQPRG
ncbi:hypothetical protein C2G38_2140398 [Gigaspora rosea]|uniref:Uncharacterized protein n=1 Tax=Gigaspora rosea TaxID=44941 RepID=A0A397VLV3_9GLOM|nr:hypothetical protein C2G38_2140398 [Gigaspora rosea]